jgi:heterodisulfide reductase subunit A
VVTDKGSKIVTACTSAATDGLKVLTDSERAIKNRKMTIELLLSRSPEEEVLINLAKEYGVEKVRFKKKDDDCILCGLCVRMCERMGVQAISFQNRGIDREMGTPFMESSTVCQSCGACAHICPTSRYTLKKIERVSNKKTIPILSEFNEKLISRNPIYIPFPQAIPKIPVIDKERCAYYLTGNCKTCKEFCEAEAIDYDQEEKTEEIDVGAIIVASGFDLFDASKMEAYGYGKYENVLNSKEFERYLSASGPTMGHVFRRSDNKEPKKIAFIQCVGSRDERTNEYCSSVCCMYAIKQAIIAQEHSKGLETHLFFMDIRAFGKEFDDYYIRAEKNHGIKFTRCRIPKIEENPKTKNLTIKYLENEEPKQETFDMIVLSCALEPSKSTKELSKKLGIDLNEYGFSKTGLFSPLESNKPGIYITGAASGPKDIPMTVTDASGAAAKASSLISSERHVLETIKEYPPERDTTGEVPRIGVIVCRCGINIASVVDVPSVVKYAKTLPYVEYASEFIYSCSQDAQKAITDLIKEHNLNRIIVSACTPRTHEPLFQSTLREAGINAHLFEMANIRDQCSWVHQSEPEKATRKAKDLVRMAVHKARFIEPLTRVELPVIQKGLVIGGGVSGMTAALELAAQGFETYLIEKESKLGGTLRKTYFTLGKDDPQKLLQSLVKRVNSNDNIHVYTDVKIKDIHGYVGNFKTTITVKGKEEKEFEHGIVIIATGAKEYTPTEYLYGKNKNVITKWELEEQLANNSFSAKNVVMIQCVGSRNEERTYCSRICCSDAIKNALKIKELSPETNIYILYKDIRTYGFREKYYKEAAEKGIIFLRYDDETDPIVTDKKGLEVAVHDFILKRDIDLKPDLIVLSNAMLPQDDTKELSQMLKLPVTKDGFFLEAHMKLRPVDFATDGVFLCGKTHSPKFIEECIAQACATASRAATILSKDSLESEAVVSYVNESLCSGCGLCADVCSFSAIEIVDGKAKVNASLCKGCGLCAGSCRPGAIQQKGFNDQQLLSVIKSLTNEVS